MVDSFRTSTMAASAPASRTIGTGQRQIGVVQPHADFQALADALAAIVACRSASDRPAPFFIFYFLNFVEILYIRDFSFIFICTTCFNEFFLSLNFCTRASSSDE